MKLKRLAIMIAVILLTIMIASIFNTARAATGSKYLTIRTLRESGYGYAAIEKKIWKIVETNSSGSTYDYDSTIYCLKGGPGFGSSDFGNGDPKVRHYTRYFDMKDPDSIPSTYKAALPDTNSNTYKALLWLLEHVYVPAPSNASSEEKQQAAEYRELLLTEAGLNGGYLEDEDIDVVQQLAIWHFTNEGDSYDVGPDESFELHVNPNKDEDVLIDQYVALSDQEADYGGERAEEAVSLYQYLVDTAEKEAANYKVTTASQPYELAQLTRSVKTEENGYIIGPFRIDKISDTEATLEGKFTLSNGSEINPTLQDASGSEFNDLNDTIGKEFYIVVPTSTDISKITFEINGIFFNTKIEYWSMEDPTNEQPVAIIEREKQEYSDKVEFTHEEEPEKVFDLALRKFITSIDGIEPTVSREPQISEDTLADLRNEITTTAEKIHPKNPLTVETGSSVIYTIRVYNEGDIDGKVTEITDYLPDGLILKQESTINSTYNWVDNGNGKITTDYLSGEVIKAFDGVALDYRDVQIECEVTASVTENDTKLKNIAEITGATDGEGEEVIDRDSTPDNVERENYGESSQEDDDDFEDLILLGRYFDLSLRKFIIQVNDTELKDADGNYLREPEVDVTPLTSGSDTTAIYNHQKTPVQVAIGDEVIYTIRVYNEGQIDGYVYEITDHLPENLEFVNDDFNARYGWRIGEDGRTVTTDITSPDTASSASRDTIYENRKEGSDKVILEAFDGVELDYIDVQIKCRVKDTAVPDEKLTNIADITDFRDSNKDEVTDRDSNEDNVTIPSDDTLPNYKDDEINREN